jgi:hypothetical protein
LWSGFLERILTRDRRLLFGARLPLPLRRLGGDDTEEQRHESESETFHDGLL